LLQRLEELIAEAEGADADSDKQGNDETNHEDSWKRWLVGRSVPERRAGGKRLGVADDSMIVSDLATTAL
jgi:hypothetical protein